jgi:hypothetical protein
VIPSYLSSTALRMFIKAAAHRRLPSFSPLLSSKPSLIIANKHDLCRLSHVTPLCTRWLCHLQITEEPKNYTGCGSSSCTCATYVLHYSLGGWEGSRFSVDANVRLASAHAKRQALAALSIRLPIQMMYDQTICYVAKLSMQWSGLSCCTYVSFTNDQTTE